MPSSGGIGPREGVQCPSSSFTQPSKVGEFRGDWPGQVVTPELQPLKHREVAEFRRNRASQTIVFEIQQVDPAIRVDADPVPISDRGIRQPVRVVPPVSGPSVAS